MNKTLFALCLCAALALTLLTGCVWRGLGGGEVVSAPLGGDEIAVMLNDTGSLCSDPGVVIDGGTVRITRGGDYVFTGVLSDGQICVDAPEDAEVRLYFGGVHLVTREGSAILAQNAGSLVLAALLETSNLIQSADGGAAVDAACDLRFTGGGALNLSSLTGRAAVSEGALTLEGGTVNLEAAGDGLWSAGCLTVEGGVLNADVAGNGIAGRTVNVSGGLLNLMAQADGLHAEEKLDVSGGLLNISAGGGLYTEGGIVLSGGELNVSADGDALHAGGDITVSGGMQQLFCSGDGVHAEGALHLSGSTLSVLAARDGLSAGGALRVSGGTTCLSGRSALRSGAEATISGGTFLAAGAESGFGAHSSQASILLRLDTVQEAGTLVSLCDRRGTILALYEPETSFDSVLLSAGGLSVGERCTVVIGEKLIDLTLESLNTELDA